MKEIKALFLFILIGFGATFLTAQDSGDDSFSGSSSINSTASSYGVAVSENYVLKTSDVIGLQVYQEADLDKAVRIEGDGTVALALIGKVKVSGMTVAEAQSLITDLLNRDYLVEPQVSLQIVEFAPRFVRVLGMVGSPGKVPMPPDSDLTLIDAISQSRGVTRLGNARKVRIKRNDGTKPFDVDYDEIRRGEAKDIILQEGDTITVPERLI
ncbi:MAG: polysaccharide export protein [Verrucomicrobia bacterium]|nr:polysaccharide export protein [Verrucomicrobiota bacterium]